MVANTMMLVGGGAILTGMGGNYFFAFPVYGKDINGSSWGYKSFFDTDPPGAWTGKVAGEGTTDGSLWTPQGVLSALWAMTGMEAQFWGLDKMRSVNEYGWPNSTAYDFGNTPGVFGQRGGIIFMWLFAAGLLLRVA